MAIFQVIHTILTLAEYYTHKDLGTLSDPLEVNKEEENQGKPICKKKKT